jgi:hypothetical protein
MNRIQLSKNFWLDEYIPRELYKRFHHKPHILVGLIDDRLVKADQMLRDKFGATTINNWWGLTDEQFKIEIAKPPGERWVRNESGLRLFGTKTGASLSQHLFGRASDKLFQTKAEDVRKYIKVHWKLLGITCIEENVSWVHSDVRWSQGNELLLVYP